jgi:hypothetical protein
MAADGSGATPRVGDLSVCFGCGAALEFGEGLVLQRINWGGLSWSERQEVIRAQDVVLGRRPGS